MENNPEEQWLTATQVCAKLQINRETLRRWRKAGKVKEYKVCGTIRFKLSEIFGG
jgi:excisionase family DNA binding protein